MENKQTRGRQRIDTSKRRETNEDRFVTFSKRRAGLYKKASELCTLCGVELGLIIFSPTGKPFTFSHPNFQAVVDRFLNPNIQRPIGGTGDAVEDARLKASIEALNQQLMELRVQREIEEERAKDLAEIAAKRPIKLLTNTNINELSPEDTQKLKVWLLNLKEKIREHRQKLVANASHVEDFPAIAGSGVGKNNEDAFSICGVVEDYPDEGASTLNYYQGEVGPSSSHGNVVGSSSGYVGVGPTSNVNPSSSPSWGQEGMP